VKVSRLARRQARELFQSCRTDGVLDLDKVRAVVQQLVTQRPRGYLGILVHFRRLVKLEVDRRTARIQSAVELAPPQQTALQAALQRRYGPGLFVQFHTNPALLGGLRVQVGSDVYDGSIRARLEALQQSL
jgi:F-type H+-transporting ATPase subunit delta